MSHNTDLIEKAIETINHLRPSAEQSNPNKYQRKVKGVVIDVYDVLVAWEVTNPAVQHAIKKLLQPGQRGHKDITTDLYEAGQSIGRAIEIEQEASKS